MRISTKIALALGALLLFTGIPLVYSLHLMRQMATLTAEVAVGFDAAALSRNLLEDFSLVRTVSRVHQTLADRDSSRRLEDLETSVDQVLNEFDTLSLPVASGVAVGELASSWRLLKQALDRWKEIESPAPKEMPREVEAGIESLETAARRLTALTRQQLLQRVEESRRISRRAWNVAIVAVSLALVAAIGLTAVLIRSINRPLGALVSGTRAVAGEQYSVRVEEAGDDEISELGRNFNAMVRRLGDLDRMKRDFVSCVSHDLKGPLASILETTSLLSEEIPGPLNEKQKKLLELTRRCAGRLSKMIANLLDFSTLESGVRDFHFEQIQLGNIVDEVVDEVAPVASEKGVRLEKSCSGEIPRVSGDREGVTQVLRNLLDNAVRYSPSDGTVLVLLSASRIPPRSLPPTSRKWTAAPAGGFVLLEVADKGPGVGDVHKERIFSKFFKVEKTQRGAERGIGLGLAICYSVVEAHNGAIWVEDNPGGGSLFRVLYPAGEELAQGSLPDVEVAGLS